MKKKGFIVLLCVVLCLSIIVPLQLNVDAKTDNLENIALNRSVTKLDDNQYKVSLESYVKGNYKSQPRDIVILINQTKRMDTQDIIKSATYTELKGNNMDAESNIDNLFTKIGENFYKVTLEISNRGGKKYYKYKYIDDNNEPKEISSTYETRKIPSKLNLHVGKVEKSSRLEHEKKVAKKIVDDLKSASQNQNIDNKIAIVSFSNKDNTFLYVNGKKIKYSDITNSDFEDCLCNINTSNGYKNICDSIDIINTCNCNDTRIDYATDIAKNICKNNSTCSVITLSDYNYSSIDETLETQIINSAISNINKLKENKTFKSFSIAYNHDKSKAVTDKHKKLLEYISSNYKDVNNIDEQATLVSDKYVVDAFDETYISSIPSLLEYKTNKTQYKINAPKINDYITDEVEIVSNSVKTYTKNYIGENKWGALEEIKTLPIEVKNNNITVENFDFNTNSVANNGTNYYGKKLVVEYIVKQKESYLGGNKVNIFKNCSGLYDADLCIKTFNQADVDLQINSVDFKVKNLDVYSTNKIKVQNFIEKFTTQEIDGKNNKDVNITYRIKKDNKILEVYRIDAGEKEGYWICTDREQSNRLLETKEYNIECSVSPVEQGSLGSVVTHKVAIANVYVPQILIKSSITKSKKANIDLNEILETSWVCDNVKAQKPTGEKPKIDILFENHKGEILTTPNNVNIKENPEVKIHKVIANGIDISNKSKIHPTNMIRLETVDINKSDEQSSPIDVKEIVVPTKINPVKEEVKLIEKPIEAKQNINNNTKVFKVEEDELKQNKKEDVTKEKTETKTIVDTSNASGNKRKLNFLKTKKSKISFAILVITITSLVIIVYLILKKFNMLPKQI